MQECSEAELQWRTYIVHTLHIDKIGTAQNSSLVREKEQSKS